MAHMAQVLAKLREVCAKPRRTAEWVEVAQSFRGPTGEFGRLGPMSHPGDVARLLGRVAEFKPRLVVDLSGSEGGSILLWGRAAVEDATIIAAGLPDRPLDAAKLPLLAAMGKRGQTIHCIARPSSREALMEEVEKLCKGRKIDFLFMSGRRPHAELRADLRHYRNRVRKGGLIAWDFVRPLVGADETCDGGTRLWSECKPMYPFHAEYLAGTNSEVGGIVAIKL